MQAVDPHWRQSEESSWQYPWRKHVSLLERPELINKWCPVSSSQSQKEEQPWFVLDKSSQHNPVFILDCFLDDIPCSSKLHAFIVSLLFFIFPEKPQNHSEITERTAMVPAPFVALSCDSGSIHSRSQKTTENSDRVFWVFLATLESNPISQLHAAVPK